MVDLMCCLTNLLFFDILLLYCYTNFNSSMICCLFSKDMYLSFNENFNSSIISRNIHPFFGTNLNSSIICCLSSGDIYIYIFFFFGISISPIASSFFECNSVECCSAEDFFETLVILSVISLPIKLPVAFELFFLKQFLLHPWQIF